MGVASISLYRLEDHLAALADSAELVTPEQEQEYQRELSEALRTTVAKRDRVAGYLAFLGSQITLEREQEARHAARRKRFESAITRLSEYVLDVIREFGTDAKGKYQKLEGNTTTLAAKKCPASVEVFDENLVPKDYRRVTVTLSVKAWEDLLLQAGIEMAALSGESGPISAEVSKSLIRKAIDSGKEVPGARLVQDKLRLEVS